MSYEDFTNINMSLAKTYFITRCFIQKPWLAEELNPFCKKAEAVCEKWEQQTTPASNRIMAIFPVPQAQRMSS